MQVPDTGYCNPSGDGSETYPYSCDADATLPCQSTTGTAYDYFCLGEATTPCVQGEGQIVWEENYTNECVGYLNEFCDCTSTDMTGARQRYIHGCG